MYLHHSYRNIPLSSVQVSQTLLYLYVFQWECTLCRSEINMNEAGGLCDISRINTDQYSCANLSNTQTQARLHAHLHMLTL